MVSSMRPGRPNHSTVNKCFPAFPKAPRGSQGGCYCTHFTDKKMEVKGDFSSVTGLKNGRARRRVQGPGQLVIALPSAQHE